MIIRLTLAVRMILEQKRRMTMITSKLVRGLAVIAGLALVSTSALAADGKQYGGSECRQVSGGTFNYFAGTVYNASTTQELNVICPFVKDSTSITNGTVTVFDRNPSLDVSCQIITEFNNASGTFQNFTTVTSSGFGSGAQVLSFGALPGNNYYYATCSIPRATSSGASDVAEFFINEP